MKKGFTLAELLIVVAIIAVLVGVSIPVFNSQLEKSREAKDLANVRSAYAEMMAAAAGFDKDATYNGVPMMVNEGVYKVSVNLKQTKDNWQGFKELDIAGIKSTDKTHWLSYPKANGICTISFDVNNSEVIFNWNGNNLITNLMIDDKGCLNGNNQSNRKKGKMMSTYNQDPNATKEGLYELEPATEYRVTFTYNPYFDDEKNPTKGIIARATLIYDSNNVAKMDSGTGKFVIGEKINQKGVTYMYTQNDDGTLTYTATFKTPNGTNPYYYGMNFGSVVLSSAGTSSIKEIDFSSGLGMSKNDQDDFRTNLANSFVLEKVK